MSILDYKLHPINNPGRSETPHLILATTMQAEKLLGKNTDSYQILSMTEEGLKIRVFSQGIHGQDGKSTKSEALLRMISPDGTIFLPNDCLRVFRGEDRRIITRSVIEQTLKYMSSNSLEFSLNVGIAEIQDSDFITSLSSKCRYYNISPHRIIIEILEEIPTDFDRHILNFTRKLRELGFRIAVDDYGALYSTLIRVMMLRPDFVKLDGICTESLSPSDELGAGEQEKVKQHLFALLKMIEQGTIKTQVIAEKVTNGEQVIQLRTYGIHNYQGFHYSEPQPIQGAT